jgi:hypothetical protein
MTANDPPHLQIIHLSDLHFGNKHRFQAQPDAAGKAPIDTGYPTLVHKLFEDLTALEAEYKARGGRSPRIAICITGDLTETASFNEFQQAEQFIRALAELTFFDVPIGLENIVCVPGNHDLKYDENSVAVRWTEFTEFHNRIFGTTYRRDKPDEFVEVVRPPKLQDCIFLRINSAEKVVKDDIEAKRGRVDQNQLRLIDTKLSEIPEEELRRSIKVALIHHHPILIPDLVEAGSNYDAIYNSGLLLNKLRSAGFHLVLHGHKHWPVTFSDDTRAAYARIEAAPMVIVASGSTSSIELPTAAQTPLNCYQRIATKWDADADQYRIRIETRGLDTWDRHGRAEIPSLWKWKTLAIDDRLHLGPSRRPNLSTITSRDSKEADFTSFKLAREAEYASSKGWFPVVDVVPSLVPGVHYEARLWLVHHENRDLPVEVPKRVTWYAGPRFNACVVDEKDDNQFCIIYHYYGPMLVKALLEFEDGSRKSCFIYVRQPENYAAGRTGR